MLFRYSNYKKIKVNLDKGKIIGFNFIINPNSDCFNFIVTQGGLYLYKMRANTTKIKLFKTFSHPVIDFSFEPQEGTLATISYSGKVTLFHLYQPKKSKLYQGSTFTLELNPSLSHSISGGPHGENLLKFRPRLDYNQFQIYKIYESTYVTHLNNLQGFLHCYKLNQDKTSELYANFPITQGIYGLGLTENLIILQSYNTQETLIYDIQSSINEYIIKVSHSEFTETLRDKRLSAEFAMRIDLNSEIFFVSDEVSVDLKTKSFKVFEISPAALVDNHPDDVKIILFLLRRDNCKMKILEKIKESLVLKTSMKKLEIIFSTLACAYRIAKAESNIFVHRRRVSEATEHLEISAAENNPNVEVKLESGVTVLMQSDIYSAVFAPVYKMIEDYRYFAEVLLSFTYFLIQNKVHVHFSLQYLLFKVLVKIKDFIRIQKLCENLYFSDSQDIALFLTSLGKSGAAKDFPNCFIMGIDMLARLGLHEIVIQELSDQGYYYDAVCIGKMHKLNDNLISEAIKKCEQDYYL